MGQKELKNGQTPFLICKNNDMKKQVTRKLPVLILFNNG